mmetsp:Transcript_26991/g.48794  ORF Transcript_26991/g.48794 Transcript_26991/m.48794 type:complete len:391 (-) Transcript_26991:349-1521(-)
MGFCCSKRAAQSGDHLTAVVTEDSDYDFMPSASKYRFTVGTRVQCRTGPDEWSVGTVIKLDYSEPGWPPGRSVPYQVQIDGGPLIFVPKDVEMICRKLTEPWWKPLMDQAERSPEALRQAGKGKDVNERNHKEETALMHAVTSNWLAGAEALISMGANVNAEDKTQSSALHRACSHGLPMIDLLLNARANPNVQDVDPEFDPEFTSTTFGDRLQHRTPLHYCCNKVNLESAKRLVKANADMNIQDAQYMTPLHLAIEEDEDEVIDFLLESGSAVDLCSIKSGMKNSPLMEAAHAGKHALAEKLIRAGAEVNKVGKQDMTALHLAARKGDVKTVKLLLDAKGDAALKSTVGTALSLASKKGSAELLQLFGEASQPSEQVLTEAQRAALYMD